MTASCRLRVGGWPLRRSLAKKKQETKEKRLHSQRCALGRRGAWRCIATALASLHCMYCTVQELYFTVPYVRRSQPRLDSDRITYHITSHCSKLARARSLAHFNHTNPTVLEELCAALSILFTLAFGIRRASAFSFSSGLGLPCFAACVDTVYFNFRAQETAAVFISVTTRSGRIELEHSFHLHSISHSTVAQPRSALCVLGFISSLCSYCIVTMSKPMDTPSIPVLTVNDQDDPSRKCPPSTMLLHLRPLDPH